MSAFTASIQHDFCSACEVLARVIRQKKELKSTHMEKEEVK